jgi:hypothetical protein
MFNELNTIGLLIIFLNLFQPAMAQNPKESIPVIWTQEHVQTSIAPYNTSGSGYRDLEGRIVNYSYNDFGGFRISLFDNQIKWIGFETYFTGTAAQSPLQASRVAEGIYFLSWGSPETGDNVVHNFNTMKVSAHIRSTAQTGEKNDFNMISGVIYCKDTPECVFPTVPLTAREEFPEKLQNNAERYGLPPLSSIVRPLTDADASARQELAGITITYATPEGPISVEVDDDQTYVSTNGKKPKRYKTYATKIDHNIYYVSWYDGVSIGQHIMFNRNTMRAFDHVSPEGERREAIYRIT